MVTASSGSSIAGSVYSLVCTVKVVDGLVVVPDVVWMNNGSVLVNGTNTTLTRMDVSGGNSTLKLTFNPLLTSYGGQYSCIASIFIPQFFLNRSQSSNVSLAVQSKYLSDVDLFFFFTLELALQFLHLQCPYLLMVHTLLAL